MVPPRANVADTPGGAHQAAVAGGDYFVGARWLSVEDIRRSTDIIAPRRLAELLPPLLAGHVPTIPVETGV
jgi:hypothetical protein